MSADGTLDGGPGASGDQVPEVYDELRKLARARLARERHRTATMQPAAAWGPRRVATGRADRRPDRRGHFFAAAALAMRQLLVERARHYQRMAHGGGTDHIEPDSAMLRLDPSLIDLVAVDEALTRLEQTDPRKAQIVSLHYFAGLSLEETAAALDLPATTVANEWAFARAWLYRVLGPRAAAPPS
jgi:RNA polymerase sigma factor (TIGR02999 family)